MSEPIVTALGRVQPNYLGTWQDNVQYNKLDYVDYQGSSYICRSNGVSGNDKAPSDNSFYWQLVAHKGERGLQGYTGDFGTPSATASRLPTGSNPSVVISVDTASPPEAKIFNFQFGIPDGPLGFTSVAANATSVPAGSNPSATATLVGDEDKTLTFDFQIPSADGEGVKQVDGFTPGEGSNDNVQLWAVSYQRDQVNGDYAITETQRAIARSNIRAAAEPTQKNYGQFMQYAGNIENPYWVATNILQVPNGGDVGQILRKQEQSYGWTQAHEVPAGGSQNAMLIKSGNADYVCGWSNPISNSEIDIIVNAS